MSVQHVNGEIQFDGPDSWPAWTDDDVWMTNDEGPDPTPEDIAFAAVEFAAQDCLERAMVPPDCDCEACVWRRTAKYARGDE